LRNRAAARHAPQRPAKAKGPANLGGPLGKAVASALVVIAIDLLVEGLGVKRAGAAGDAGDD
jgi:hypothetical protein